SGIYNLSVQDSIGCLQVVTVLLADSNAPNLSLVDLTNNACADDATGSIELTSTGGSGNITYLWSNSDTLSEISNLNSGTYNVTAQDTLGCSTYGSHSISDISKPFDIDFLERGISCFGDADGQIEVLINGGFEPYTYNWNPAQSDTNQLFNLSIGDYSVTVVDNQNCASSAATTIITQPKFFLEIDSLFSDSSNNGQNDAGIFMSVYGGTPPYKYNWNNGLITQDISQVDTGFYSVIVSDQFGCKLSYEKYLSNDPLRVESTSKSPQIQVFPNPVLAKNAITIGFEGMEGTYTLRDIRGRVLESGILYSPNTHLIIKNPGIYLLSVDDNSGNTSIHKLIAQ
ncbi:T9SS type A sorting domain-containing protein, partial [Salibacteraceae bacterium]|nr:T9SS type A sorting domain-containing protein [Salibacteraceae bacterium]